MTVFIAVFRCLNVVSKEALHTRLLNAKTIADAVSEAKSHAPDDFFGADVIDIYAENRWMKTVSVGPISAFDPMPSDGRLS